MCVPPQVRRPDGVITNLNRPLAEHKVPGAPDPPPPSQGAFAHLGKALKASRSSLLPTPVLFDLRPRIAAALRLLGYQGDWRSKISARDSAALDMADNYDTFRQGEVWEEVAARLGEAAVKPIAADALLMSTAVENKLRVAIEVGVYGERV